MIIDAVKGRLTLDPNGTEAGKKVTMHPAATGVLLSLTNPYWVIWWATVGLTYLTLALKNGPIGAASFFTGHIMADLLWYSLISAIAAGGRRFMNQHIYKIVIIICGLFLAGLGCYFVSSIFY